MKTLKQFTKWFTKTGKANKTQKTNYLSDYDTTKDFYKRRREAYEQEQERLKKWREELKKNKMSNYTYNTSIGHLPGGSIISSGNINSTSLTNSAISINGDPTDGSVKIDVPLLVNGRNVMKELDEMRDALLLLKRDVDMEKKYPRLKELKDQYEAALEKYKTFEALK